MTRIKYTPSRIYGAIGRRISRARSRLADGQHSSFLTSTSRGELHRLPSAIPRLPIVWDDGLLSQLADHFIRHEFDILGSGWVQNRYGAVARGFGGHRYSPQLAVMPDEGDEWIGHYVNAANAAESRRIWRLIEREGGYTPIDWQRDIKSGHRWSAREHFSSVPISPAAGVDIKVPWELGRLQHLPLLAMAALRATPERARIYVREVQAQLLDFIALNPPRFGVNWRCPMDIGIRVANMVLALDLLEDVPHTRDEAIDDVFKRSIEEHASHIVKHLEWSEEARSNHYLANIIGVLFAASVLPRSEQCDAWLGFAVQELEVEILRQFRTDGGNFEASTGYHALSAEMAITGVLLANNLDEEKAKALEAYNHRAISVRPPFHAAPLTKTEWPDGTVSPFNREVLSRINGMTAFLSDVIRPDGKITQIGDMDSGRLFKTHSTWQQTDDNTLAENILDRRDVVKAGAAFPMQDAPNPAHIGEDLEDIQRTLSSLPSDQWREWVVPVPPTAVGDLSFSAYEQFGLYIVRGRHFYLSIRCFDGRLDGEWGHSHDDNLATELAVDGNDVVTDPGSFVYSPDTPLRTLYSASASHFAPRAKNRLSSRIDKGLFAREHDAHARCLYFGPSGFAGQLRGNDWVVTRTIAFEENAILIRDGSEPFELAPYEILSATHKVTEGYGKQTDRPICSL